MEINLYIYDQDDKCLENVKLSSIEDKNHFSYIDDNNGLCDVSIFDDGLYIEKKNSDYKLELCLRNKSSCKISTVEGIIELDTKVVDFLANNDILVMHYLIDEQLRKIEINF